MLGIILTAAEIIMLKFPSTIKLTMGNEKSLNPKTNHVQKEVINRWVEHFNKFLGSEEEHFNMVQEIKLEHGPETYSGNMCIYNIHSNFLLP